LSVNNNPGFRSGPDIDSKTGQIVEEAEDNLSRHSTEDSHPPVAEQERTSVREDGRRPGGSFGSTGGG
jgi:hypothetical protein